MATGDIKLCIDCAYCQWPPIATGTDLLVDAFATCSSPSSEPRAPSYVTGQKPMQSCFAERHNGGCGVSGAWFEPRKGATGA